MYVCSYSKVLENSHYFQREKDWNNYMEKMMKNSEESISITPLASIENRMHLFFLL